MFFLIFYNYKQFTVERFSVVKYRVDVLLRMAKSVRAKWKTFKFEFTYRDLKKIKGVFSKICSIEWKRRF